MVNPVQNGQVDRSLIDKLAKFEYRGVERIQSLQKKVNEELDLFRQFKTRVSDFWGLIDRLKKIKDFKIVQVEVEPKDSLNVEVVGDPQTGQYEFKIDQLANRPRLLSQYYKSPDDIVGFGYISLDDGERLHHIRLPLDGTVRDLADEINKLSDISAQIVNTGRSVEDSEHKEGDFQIIVHSSRTGKQAKLYLDPDLVDLNADVLSDGQNLKITYNGVTVFHPENQMTDLIPGLKLNFQRTSDEPVRVVVQYDLPKMADKIQEVVDQYNNMLSFIQEQNILDPLSRRLGPLGNDSLLNQFASSVRRFLSQYQGVDETFRHSLMDFGITTDPRSGTLKFDRDKFVNLAAGHEREVIDYFCETSRGDGWFVQMSQRIDQWLKETGGLPSREKSYEQQLKQLDQQLIQNQNRAEQRVKEIKQKFQRLEGVLQEMQTQNQFLRQNISSPMPQ